MFTRQQLLSSAQALAHVSYMDAKGIASKEIRDAFRRAAHDMVTDLAGGSTVFTRLKLTPNFTVVTFPAKQTLNLTIK